MCAECKRKEVYKFDLCEECYGEMFEELHYGSYKVVVVQKVEHPLVYELQYALSEGSRYITHDTYISVSNRFELHTEFFKSGKITLEKASLFTERPETEVIEPIAIRFLPVESSYVKSPAVVSIPSVLEPRLLWTKGDFDRWCREIMEVRYGQNLSQSEQFKAVVEISQRYGMELKEV